MLNNLIKHTRFDKIFVIDSISAIILLLYFVFFLYRSVVGIMYPFELGDYHESYLFIQSKLVSQGEPLYSELNSEPFHPRCIHMPLYFWVVGNIFSIFGTSFFPGRLIAFLSSIIIGIVIYLILERETKSIRISIIGCLFFYSSHIIYNFSPFFRADFFATAISITGIYVAFRWWNTRAIYLSALLLVLALFARQTEIAGVIAVVVFLYFQDRRLAIKVGGFILFMVLGTTAVLSISTNGTFLFDTVFLALIHPKEYYNTIRFSYRFITLHPILLSVVLAYPVIDSSRREWLLLGIWAVLVTLISLWGIGLVDAGSNHFIEMVAAFCILFGLSLNKIKKSIVKPENNAAGVLLSFAILMQTLLMFHAPHLPKVIQNKYPVIFFNDVPPAVDRSERESVAKLIKETEGKILSMDGTFIVDDDVDNKIEVFPSNLYSYIYSGGLWDPTPLLNRIRNKEYALIVSDFYVYDQWKKVVGDALLFENYELVLSTPARSYWVFKPKP